MCCERVSQGVVVVAEREEKRVKRGGGKNEVINGMERCLQQLVGAVRGAGLRSRIAAGWSNGANLVLIAAQHTAEPESFFRVV